MQIEAIETWVETLLSAWKADDISEGAERAVSCFSEAVIYQETPFATALSGHDEVRQYWVEMLSSQEDVSYSYEIKAWQDAKLVLNWRVKYRDVNSSGIVSLNGVSVGLFNDKGLCYDWREWWHVYPIKD